MFPLIIHLGKFPINFHLITDFVSMSLGVWMYWNSSRRDTLSVDGRYGILFGAGIGALVGSRLLGGLENPFLFLHPPTLLYYYVSKTIIGGIAGGIIGVELAKLILGHKESTGDRITIPLIVSIIIGRIGCFITGVSDGTVGSVCHYVWCFAQGDGLSRHPTVLYEILFLVTLTFILLKFQKMKLQSGTIFRIFIIFYFTFRFLIEFLKSTVAFAVGLSATQIVCLIFVIWYTLDIIIKKEIFYGRSI